MELFPFKNEINTAENASIKKAKMKFQKWLQCFLRRNPLFSQKDSSKPQITNTIMRFSKLKKTFPLSLSERLLSHFSFSLL